MKSELVKIKKETIREAGKLLLDFTKIIVAIAVITPFVQNNNVEVFPFLSASISMVTGLYLINKGAKNG
ncbi:hypothetical protein QJU43_00055 [Pasteurella atlantica]|uniref:Uncharacterized protein n=3 Tax=Pasteurellaceae TaxID=712 RepID=A0AAQ4LTZ5_9PAST|nr:hypothetical protein [Pasteurella atlantica]MBR0574292.1 hypothetical protein [Pasteurella atlantica]MDP8032869.1 hypothetical protein [Pasteurella atlantica]MDP8034625.1 hypothetical protein [Pasteurella atlantica]MDP8036575.1 hypothetical protein [Pasteurella atlantica]MDP8040196.1 hypothetical protein [Pasteurella atlantica]